MVVYDRPGVLSRLTAWMLKVEVVETLDGCVTWSPSKAYSDNLRQVNHSLLLRYVGWRKRTLDEHTVSYADALVKTGSDSIEATVRETADVVRGRWRRTICAPCL